MILKNKLPSKQGKNTEARSAIYLLYKLLNALLPIGLLILIRVGLVELSILVALFSKWRVFAVKPRHIWPNIRSNAVDIIVKLSTLSFIIQASGFAEQLGWTVWYILWLTVIKPGSSKALIIFQATAGHVLGVSAVLLYSNRLNELVLLALVWFIALSAARHFLSAYEETKSHLIASIWALFVLELTWVLSNWLLVYVVVPQLIFILAVLGYALGSIYDASKKDTLKPSFIRQQAIMTIVVLIFLSVLADWQGNI